MNQILSIPLKKNKKKLFKLQFLISNFIILCFLIYFSFNYFSMFKQEEKSNQLINNYNISKLYSNTESDLFGIIEIPKINVYYPVFSSLNDELLKVSPCKFYGSTPNNFGNICIAGHNYNNNLFFSNLSYLELHDEIFLYDNNEKKFIYEVFNIYEVEPTNLAPMLEYSKTQKTLTLITCNNLTKNRIVVKANQKDF